MTKKSLIAKYVKTIKSVHNKKRARILLLNLLKQQNSDFKYQGVHKKLQKLPKKSFKTRAYTRCWKSFRARSVDSFTGLSRMALRELANNCALPGIGKASW